MKERRVIYKYPLTLGQVTVETPLSAELLSVKKQNDTLVAYFSIPFPYYEIPENEEHKFYIVGTGIDFDISRKAKFIDTVLYNDDSIVLHVFKLEDE